MEIVYFAWVREQVGIDRESVDIPGHVETVAALIAHLREQDARYAEAFADPAKLRFALDQEFVKAEAVLDGAQELAIFPPVTGG